MARPIRIQYPGAIYHVMSRGNAKQDIFLGDFDRLNFLRVLGDVVDKYGWCCYAYCLMPNHYHLVVETPESNLAEGMRYLNGVYTQKFNFFNQRVGHVFQGRYKAMVVEQQNYLNQVIRYVLLNPVRANLTELPARYRWSSLWLLTYGRPETNNIVDASKFWALFGDDRQAKFVLNDYLSEGVGDDFLLKMKEEFLIGSTDFLAKVKSFFAATDSREVPRRQRLIGRPSLDGLFAGNETKIERNNKIIQASRDYGYSLSEISRVTGLHYSSISKLIKGKN